MAVLFFTIGFGDGITCSTVKHGLFVVGLSGLSVCIKSGRHTFQIFSGKRHRPNKSVNDSCKNEDNSQMKLI